MKIFLDQISLETIALGNFDKKNYQCFIIFHIICKKYFQRIHSVRCAAHILQLCVDDALQSIEFSEIDLS